MILSKKVTPKELINSLATYLFALVLILECRSVWTTVPAFSSFNNLLLLVLFSATIVRLVSMKISTEGSRKALYVSLLSLFIGVVWGVATGTNLQGLIKFIFAVVLLVFNYFSTLEKDRKKLLFKYKTLVVGLAAISLFFWLLGPIISLIQPTGFVLSNWTGRDELAAFPTYYNLQFVTQTFELMGVHIVRNTSIFTEAPMASFHFSIALLIESFICKKRNRVNFILLSITILSTFSTTGIGLLAVTTFYLLMKTDYSSVIIKTIRVLIFPAVFLLLTIFIQNLFSARLATEGSGKIRLDDFVIGIRTWLERPLFGYGYGNSLPIMAKMGLWRASNRGFSNSVTLLLAQGGLLMFSVYFIPIAIGIKNAIIRKNFDKLIFSLLFVYLFSITITTYQFLLIFIILYIWDSTNIFDGTLDINSQ